MDIPDLRRRFPDAPATPSTTPPAAPTGALAAREDPHALTWAVLGDSAAVGIGAETMGRTYVAQAAARVSTETGRPVRVVNLAVSGAMAKDVLADQLPLIPAGRVDAATGVVGGSDVTWAWRFREKGTGAWIGDSLSHAASAPPPALSTRHTARHKQPARAAAARTFRAIPGDRGGAHLDTQCHADRIPPDTRRVHRASCGALTASRRRSPLPLAHRSAS